MVVFSNVTAMSIDDNGKNSQTASINGNSELWRYYSYFKKNSQMKKEGKLLGLEM